MPNPRSRGVASKKKQIIGVKQENGHYKMTRIHSKDDKSLWSLLLQYFDTLKIGDEFTRLDMLKATYEENVVTAMRGKLTSVDNYKGYLKVLGFLTTIKPGVYQKQLNMPTHLTVSTVRKAMKERWEWGWWFKPLHKKLGIEEKDLK